MVNNTPPPKPLSIQEAGGITNFLNLLVNRTKHNELGAADLAIRVKLRVPIARIMEDFNVKSENTVKHWIKLLKEEQEQSGQSNQDTSINRTEVGWQGCYTVYIWVTEEGVKAIVTTVALSAIYKSWNSTK